MGLLDAEIIGRYNTAQRFRFWTSETIAGTNTAGVAFTIEATGGRNNGPSLKLNTGSANNAVAYIQKTLAPADNTAIPHFGFRLSGAPGSRMPFFSIMDGGTHQLTLCVNSDMTITVLRGDAGGTVLGTTSFALSAGALADIALKAVIHGSTGSFTLYVNGASRLTASGINTAGSGVAQWTATRFGLTSSNSNGSLTMNFCDFAWLDGSGSAPYNDHLGPVTGEIVFPNGDGTCQFTRSTGAQNFALVDENPANDDTDYNESSTVGHIDRYDYAALAGHGTILAVALTPCARKVDAGARGINDNVEISAADHAGAGADAMLSTDYLYYPFWRTQDPDAAAAWTEAAVNGARFGPKVTV